jgi:hypothetical protein
MEACLVRTPKLKEWDPNTLSMLENFDDLLEDVIVINDYSIKVNDKPNRYYGVYEVQIKGTEVGEMTELDEKKEKINYSSESSLRNRTKKEQSNSAKCVLCGQFSS